MHRFSYSSVQLHSVSSPWNTTFYSCVLLSHLLRFYLNNLNLNAGLLLFPIPVSMHDFFYPASFLLLLLCLTDCAKHDPDVSEDVEKNFVDLLSEELKLREAEALENQQRADMQLLEAKKMTSQYQKEADKCNSGMETCEVAREKSEAALVEQKKFTAMWEMRARQKGWKGGAAKS